MTKATGLHPIDWADHKRMQAFLQGKHDGVLHLHGHWSEPERVVLGSKSYADHALDERRKLLQTFSALDRSTIFIGCSADGLSDPDFSKLDAFVAEWADVAKRRYWLVRQEVDASGVARAPDRVP